VVVKVPVAEGGNQEVGQACRLLNLEAVAGRLGEETGVGG
jgi:hypothetical protein